MVCVVCVVRGAWCVVRGACVRACVRARACVRVFRCMLVSTTKPHAYCVGEVRAGKARPRAREEALEKFKEGLIFLISKVALGKEGKKQYMHAPHKVVIDLGSTRAVPVMARPGAQLVPAPETTVA